MYSEHQALSCDIMKPGYHESPYPGFLKIPGYLKMPDFEDAFGALLPFSLTTEKFLGIAGEAFLEMASDKKGVSGNSRSKIFWESTASRSKHRGHELFFTFLLIPFLKSKLWRPT